MDNENVENKFWIVVDTVSPTNVGYKHSAFMDAQKEAMRLTRQHPSSCFAVMESIVAYKTNDLARINYVDPVDNPSDPNYIPF